MKSIKIFFLATVAIVAGLFTACSDDDFKAGPEVDGAQVYFPENVTTQHSISDDVSSIAIPVKRIAKDEALTVAVLASDESGLFTIPSSVSFAAGKETSELLITFDRTKLEDGKEYPLSFLINDEDNTTPYGNRSLDITVMPWPWVKMGTGKFREGWLSDVFTGNMFEIDVTVHSHKSKEGIYMVEEMLGWPYMTEFFGATQEELSEQFSYTPSNIVIDCSNATQVTIEEQWSGITENSNGYGNFMIASAEPGTLVNGVITFPKDGLTAKLVGLDREFPANSQGTFRIMLPGAEIVDYTLSAVYDGMKVSADGETASAVIDFTYGADVTGISYVLASGNVSDTADEIAAAIAAGTAENIYEVKDFAVGAEKVSVEAELEASGVYTVIALPKNKAGKLLEAEASASSFFFPGKGGSSAPECDLDAMLGLVSVNWPEQSADCPDESSLYFEITGSELESLFTWLTPTANLEALLAEGASEEELIDAYGTDQSSSCPPSTPKAVTAAPGSTCSTTLRTPCSSKPRISTARAQSSKRITQPPRSPIRALSPSAGTECLTPKRAVTPAKTYSGYTRPQAAQRISSSPVWATRPRPSSGMQRTTPQREPLPSTARPKVMKATAISSAVSPAITTPREHISILGGVMWIPKATRPTIRSYSRWMHRRNSFRNSTPICIVLYSMPTILTSATCASSPSVRP